MYGKAQLADKLAGMKFEFHSLTLRAYEKLWKQTQALLLYRLCVGGRHSIAVCVFFYFQSCFTAIASISMS